MTARLAEPLGDQHVQVAAGALRNSGEIALWAVRFGMLGDATRLKILFALHHAPGITVSDLAQAVGISDNAASHSLSGLRTAGIVASRRDGRFRRWSVTDQAIHDILHSIGATHSALHRHIH